MTDKILEYDTETLSRTIQFKWPNKFCYHTQVYTQFNEYGEIRSSRCDEMDDNNDVTFYIEFEDIKIASELLSKGHIYINDNKIRIKSMNIDDQSMNSSKDKESILKSADKNPFDILNDDCLRFLFKKLHILSLFSVANVCVRFNEISKEIFHLKFKNEDILFKDLIVSYPISLKQVENFFENFGRSIKFFWIHPKYLNHDNNMFNEILRMIHKYCINIECLGIFKFGVEDEVLNEVLPLFSRLKSLTFNCTYDKTLYKMFPVPTQLRKLHIEFSELDGCISTGIALPKMDSLRLCDYSWDSVLNIDYIQSFMKLNPQLISIHIFSFIFETTSLFKIIWENLPNIETLLLDISEYGDDNFSTNLKYLGKLKRLEHFSFAFGFNNKHNILLLMEEMLENDVKLKILKIRCSPIDDDVIDVISQFKSIENLTFSAIRIFNKTNLIQLLKQLPNLCELRIPELIASNNFLDTLMLIIPFAKQLSLLHIDISIKSGEFIEFPNFNGKELKHFNELSEIIRKRENPKKLIVKILCQIYEMDEIKGRITKLIEKDSDWLFISIFISASNKETIN